MKNLIWSLTALGMTLALFIPGPSRAQTMQAQVVGTCGTPLTTPQVGKPYVLTQDATATLCTKTGGGGGGAVTAAAGSYVTGFSPDIGTLVSPATGSLLDLTTRLLSAAQSSLAAGTNTIGSVAPLGVTTTDKSGTLTAGGSAQNAIALNTSRRGWCIQNTDAAEVMYVRVNGTASATTGTKLTAGTQVCSSPGLVDTAAVSVFAATTAHPWSGFEVQ